MWVKLLNDIQMRPLPSPPNNPLCRNNKHHQQGKTQYNNATDNNNAITTVSTCANNNHDKRNQRKHNHNLHRNNHHRQQRLVEKKQQQQGGSHHHQQQQQQQQQQPRNNSKNLPNVAEQQQRSGEKFEHNENSCDHWRNKLQQQPHRNKNSSSSHQSHRHMQNSAPSVPERIDSLQLQDMEELRLASWFQAGIPRDVALEVLSAEPVGSFLVRASASRPSCYALSVRVPATEANATGISNYLICRGEPTAMTSNGNGQGTATAGYRIKGCTKTFPSLTALIVHHSVLKEMLPVTLSLSRADNPAYATSNTNNNNNAVIATVQHHRTNNSNNNNASPSPTNTDPDYNSLHDFRRIMAELQVV